MRHWPKGPHQTWPWSGIFGAIDRILRALEPYFPRTTRKLAIERARRFVTERLNGDDGLGAIFPAMANSVLMFDALGYPADHPDLVIARSSLEKLLVVKDDEAYCQPCLSPVWDTALAAHALLEVGGADAEACAQRGLEWLKPLQVLDTVGDWAATPAARAARRLGLSICQSALSRCRRYRGRRHGHGPCRQAHPRGAPLRLPARPWSAAGNGSRGCRARTAAGARSTPTTPITTSTRSPSPITARCSIRRRRT